MIKSVSSVWTYAVVATWVVLVLAEAVGAVGVPRRLPVTLPVTLPVNEVATAMPVIVTPVVVVSNFLESFQ